MEYLKVLLGKDCALLGYYASSSGNSLPTFWYNLSVPSSRVNNRVAVPKRRLGITTTRLLALQDGTDRLYQNVGKELALHTAY